MRILRHEAGHAMQHGYRLHRRPAYQRLFGKSSTQYPTSYRPNPASRQFVQHLRAYYAQAHPDEDFAETFAVWMQPRARWRKRYQGWGALKKLEYVDALMEELEGVRAPVKTRARVAPISQLDVHAARALRGEACVLRRGLPEHVRSRALSRLLDLGRGIAHRELASRFITRHAKEIRALVARWTGESEFTIDQLLHDMIGRSRDAQAARAGPRRASAARLRRHARRAIGALPLPPTGVDPAMSRARRRRTRRRLRVLVLMETGIDCRPTTSEALSEQERYEFKTENDVLTTLRALGHEARALEVKDELGADPPRRWRSGSRTSSST